MIKVVLSMCANLPCHGGWHNATIPKNLSKQQKQREHLIEYLSIL